MLEIVKRPRVKNDILEAADYLETMAGLKACDRFLEVVENAFHTLALMPGTGALRDYGNAELPGLRMLPVPHFRKYLIFYIATAETLEIIRILHGAQNIKQIIKNNDPD